MKTHVILAAALALAPVSGRAFDLGIKGGVNIANADVDDATAPSTDSITGLVAGGFLSLGLGPIELEPNLLFSVKGYQYDASVAGAAYEVVNNFQYIEIPVLLKWFVIPAGPVKPYLGAGPSLSFLMSAESKAKLAGSTTTTDVKDALGAADYAAVIAAGVRLGLAVVSLHAEIRYSIGLADVSDTSGASLKNNTVSILAGVGF
jgi:hypothetical protein